MMKTIEQFRVENRQLRKEIQTLKSLMLYVYHSIEEASIWCTEPTVEAELTDCAQRIEREISVNK